jgi:hypothetical protein
MLGSDGWKTEKIATPGGASIASVNAVRAQAAGPPPRDRLSLNIGRQRHDDEKRCRHFPTHLDTLWTCPSFVESTN